MGRARKHRECGCYDCFVCPYPDCILDDDGKIAVVVQEQKRLYQQKFRAEHAEEIKAYHKKWRDAHPDKVKENGRKQRHKKQLEQMRMCYWCSKENELETQIIKYRKKYFCSVACLAAYLVAETKKHDELRYVLYGEGEQASGAET